MDIFNMVMQNQLSFNKMLETQIQQIASALPHPNNGNPPSQLEDPVEETVKSTITLLEDYEVESLGSSQKVVLEELEVKSAMEEVNGQNNLLPMSEDSSAAMLNRL